MENTAKERIQEIVLAQKEYFASGATRDLKFREQQLIALQKGLKKWEKHICDAIWTDLHKSYEEAYVTEIGIVHAEIRDHLKHFRKWARRENRPSPLTIMPSRSYIVKEPLGCTLILSPWNYPIQLLLNPLVGAISAGCTALLKPSPYVPNVSLAIEDMIRDTFEERYIGIVQGNREVNAEIFRQRYDLIFLTGSPSLGKIAMRSAAENLTPCILELGGKSPCIVDREADIKLAARRVAWGKCLNSGQTCIAPDYLFVHEDVKDEFIEEFGRQVRYLYPDGITADNSFYVHMVKDSAFDRVEGYLKDGVVLYGGHTDREKRWIEPTLLGNVAPDSPVMTEEIFGPIFPLNTFHKLSEVEEYVNSHEKPLAFYYFGSERKGWDLISRTTSGGACLNDTIIHIVNAKIPFGGVGNSGMGSYHGRLSFDAFTHRRAVVASPTWIDLPFRYMPYKFFSLVKKLL